LSEIDERIDENRKAFLLEWLLTRGREPVYRYILWQDNGLTDSVLTLCFNWAIHKKYINQERDKVTSQFTHAITEEGIKYLEQHK
jgi:hypothetical protein